MIHYIADKEHYTKVLTLCEKVKHDLWIDTTLYKKNGGPFLITDRPEFRVIQPHEDCIIGMIERNM